MPFTPGTRSRAFLGALHLSGYTRDVQAQFTQQALDVTTLADTARVFILGQNEATAAVSMILDADATATAQYPILAGYKAPASPTTPFTMMTEGYTALSTAWMMGALETSLATSSTAAGTVDLSLGLTVDGDTDFGSVLEPLTAVTGTGNGTARDLTAQTTNGGVAHLHVTAFSGLTSDVVTIEHSTDGATGWATLVTFTTVTGTTSQRSVVASGTTVRRYLRVVDTVSGTGSCTRLVTFVRR